MRPIHYLFAGAAALVFLFLVVGSAQAGTLVPGGTISVDTTWTPFGSPYTVLGTIYVRGMDGPDAMTTLTIQPGVEVRFFQGARMEIGSTSASLPGRLTAVGTPTQPILLTSDQGAPSRGYWGPLLFSPYADESSLEWATVEYGGYSTANIQLNQNAPTLRNVTVREGSQHGIYISSAAPLLEDVTMSGFNQYPLYVASGSVEMHGGSLAGGGPAAAYAPADSTFLGVHVYLNGVDEVLLWGGTFSTRDAQWGVLTNKKGFGSLPYELTGSATFYGTAGDDLNTTLTIDPGVTLQMRRAVNLIIGSSSTSLKQGALIAQGTQLQPIRVTSDQAEGLQTSGWWGRFQFERYGASELTRLENVTFEYGGYGGVGTLYFNVGSGTFRDLVIDRSDRYGIYVSQSSPTLEDIAISGTGGSSAYGLYHATNTPLTLTRLTISDTTGRPLRMYPLVELNDVLAVGSTIPEIDVAAGDLTVDNTWPVAGEPYHVTGTFRIYGVDGPDMATTLTIAPGVTVTMARYSNIYVGHSSTCCVGGGLTAVGSPTEPIVFTSDEPAGAKSAGWWGRIQLDRYNNESATQFDHVTFGSGGYGGVGTIYVNQGLGAIRNSVVDLSNTYGIYVSTSSPTIEDVVISNTAGATGYAIYHATNTPLTLTRVTVSDSAGRPLRMYPLVQLVNVVASGSATPEIDVVASDLTVDTTWPQAGEPYHVTGTFRIYGLDGADDATTLTVDAGVTVKMSRYSILYVGHSSTCCVGGGLTTLGNADAPVRFTSDQPDGAKTAGWWGRIQFDRYSNSSNTNLDFVTFEYGGYGGVGTLHLNGGMPNLRDTTVDRSQTWGIYHAVNEPMTIERAAITNTVGRPLAMFPRLSIIDLTLVGSSTPQVHVFATDLTVDTTWPALAEPYFLSGSMRIYGQDGPDLSTTLTIQAGTTIEMSRYAILYVGHSSTCCKGGGLLAPGTPSQPILFTSDQPADGKTPGWWGRIQFDRYLDPSTTIIENTRFEYGGYGNLGTFYLVYGTPTFHDVTVANSQTWGVYHGGPYEAELSGISIVDTAGKPLAMFPMLHLTNVAISGSATPIIEVFASDLTVDNTWPDLGDPYHVSGTFRVHGTAGEDGVTTLTLAPGVILQMARYSYLYVGYPSTCCGGGALVASGTTTQPITFTSDEAQATTPGWWGRIQFDVYASEGASVLDHVIVERGGYGNLGALYVDRSSLLVTNTTFRDSAPYGVYLANADVTLRDVTVEDTVGSNAIGIYVGSGGSRVATLDGVTITGTSGVPIRMWPDTSILSVTLENNQVGGIEVTAGSVTKDATWRDWDVPYLTTGTIEVYGADGPDGATVLTIEPGVEIQMAQYSNVYVGNNYYQQGGAIDARGTEGSPIVFTSRQAEVHTPGYWYNFQIGTYASAAQLHMEHVNIVYNYYGLYIYNAPDINISDVHVEHTTYYGIYLGSAHRASLERVTTNDTQTGLYVYYTNDAQIRNGSFAGSSNSGYLYGGDRNEITGNQFYSPASDFNMAYGNANLIANNAFTRDDGLSPVRDNSGTNLWNMTPTAGEAIHGGPMLGGNLYSDYTGIDFSNPSDGLGDTLAPYAISPSIASDAHPLALIENWIPDITPPVTTVELSGTLHSSGWFNSPVAVTLLAEDDLSGVDTTYYGLDGDDPVPYTGTFSLGTEGRHELLAYSTDRAGNTEGPLVTTIDVDATPPTILLDLDDDLFEDICFTPDATDGASGLDTLTFSVLRQGAAVLNRTDVLLLNVALTPGVSRCADLDVDGIYTLLIDAVDVAGNAQNLTQEILVDAQPPQLTVARPLPGEAYAGATALSGDDVPSLEEGVALVIKETLVLAEATDAGTGVARGELWVDGRLVASDWHSPFRWWSLSEEALGYHEVTVKAYDKAGHVASITRRVLLVSGPTESAKSLEADVSGGATCVAAGAAYGLFHSTFTDVSEHAMLARSLANLSLQATHDAASIASGPGGRLSGGIITSTCDASPVPAHSACATSGAADPVVSLAPLPFSLRAVALHAQACVDPAQSSGDAVTDDVLLVANNEVVARFDASDPNTVIPLRASTLAGAEGGDDPILAYLIFNEQHEDVVDVNKDKIDDCRRRSGAALHALVMDPLTGHQSVAADIIVGWVSVSACKMTPQLTVASDPYGGGVTPGAAAQATATARGPLAGQRVPTGDVAFGYCKPSCAQPSPMGQHALNATGRATSDATSDTVAIGEYCWKAAYPGDAYYQRASAADSKLGCFSTGRQGVSFALTALPGHDNVIPYSPAGALAWLNQTGAWPGPTGTVTFYLCGPKAIRPEGDSASKGGSDGGNTGLACPLGTGPAFVVSVNAVAGNISVSDLYAATGAIGTYCWGASYSGDAFYLPQTIAPDQGPCFTTVRQLPAVAVSASTQGPFLPGGTVGASASVLGARPAEGSVAFYVCAPRDVEPGVGCVRGGTSVGWPTQVVSGVATTSAPFTDTVFLGTSCYRAEYYGDNYYLPATTTNIGSACYRVNNPCATPGASSGGASTTAGTHLAIGAPGHAGKGAVCLFDATTGAYERMIVGPGSSGGRFGAALGASGTDLLVGAPSAGAGTAYRFDPSSGALLATMSTGASGDKFGAALAGAPGGAILVGAPGSDANATDSGVVYRLSSSGSVQSTYWNPSADAGDAFGSSLAVIGNLVAVGAPNDDSAATNAGAVHVLTLPEGDFVVTIVSPTQGAGDRYGSALTTLDVNTFIVGAPGANAAHAHTAATGSLLRTFRDPIAASGNNFGASVGALDGRVLVGAPGTDAGAIDSGAAYLFHATTGALLDSFRDPTPAANDQLGASVTGAASNAIIGAPGDDGTSADGGASHFFDSASAPALVTVPGSAPGAEAGASVATDGQFVIVGMPGADRVEVRDINGAIIRVIEDPNPASGDRFGAAVATANGYLVVGAPRDDTLARDAGAAYLYSVWWGGPIVTFQRPAARFDDFFGAAVALDDLHAVIGAPGDDTGAPGAGAVFAYDLNGARLRAWINPTPAFNDAFGAAVALSGDRVAVGAPGDDLVVADAGAVHLYDLLTGTRIRTHAMPNAALGDALGTSVAFLGDLLAAGAPGDDAGATNTGSVQVWRASDGGFVREILKPRAQVAAAFGSSLAATATRFLVGAPGDDAGAPGAGAAILMESNGAHIRTLLAPTPTPDARFGGAVALASDRAYAGAPGTGSGAGYGFDAPWAEADLVL